MLNRQTSHQIQLLADNLGLIIEPRVIGTRVTGYSHNLIEPECGRFCREFLGALTLEQMATLLNEAVAGEALELAGPARRLFSGEPGQFVGALSMALQATIMGWTATYCEVSADDRERQEAEQAEANHADDKMHQRLERTGSYL